VKASVDSDYCAGHGACVVTCPDVFEIGEHGYAEVLVDEIPVSLGEAVRQACEECPTQAISVTE
jgi:ferredoxin